MMRRREGLFLPALISSAMIASMLFTAQLSQLVATARHVRRIDGKEQARLLADSIGRLESLPAGATGFSVEGLAVQVLVHPDGRRDVVVQPPR